ncbi:MAG: hypothetical protein H7039_03970 [Bryobacteraceae bacterium]|nr:hypothetical protein [Bryobacteraceae bacterium]
MKSLAVLVLATTTILNAQSFVTGQGARAVIGQRSFTLQKPGASDSQLGAAGGLALVGDTLFVVDSSRVFAENQNHRVLIFPNISTQLPSPKASLPWAGDTRCPVCGGTASTVIGQTDFTKTSIGVTQSTLRNPTAAASNGQVLAIADTNNNRVLIWLNIPTANGTPADVVIGQANFTSNGVNFGGSGSTPSARGLRGPQGLWIQDGRLYIADTQNNRVLIFNSIPRSNGASADLVLGAPDFTTFVQSDLVQATLSSTPSNMLSPVAVTSDGTRLFVTDLGHNRVLIWNRIPTQNATPVDVVVGQPDATSTTENLAYVANNSSRLCPSNGRDAETGDPTYPAACGATLNFPRFALSDGTRLFIADSGNDRVLVYNEIPNSNGKFADVILGQFTDEILQDDFQRVSAVDTLRTPSSLAWDGTNLYVSDPFNHRVVVYTPGDTRLPVTGVRNAASRDIFALTAITFTANPKENDEVRILIDDLEYKYKAVRDDAIAQVVRGLVAAINAGAGDSKVLATANVIANQLILTARVGGVTGNAITYAITFSDAPQITVATANGTLGGGQDAAQIAPGTLISILGEDLADETVSAPEGVVDLPQTLGNVELYIDGIRAPLLFVSPTEIRSQMPWEVSDSTSASVYVRRLDRNNRVLTTTAIGVPIIPQNPGIFAIEGGTDPRPVRAAHSSSSALGVVSVDGSVRENDTATVTIEDRPYTYTVKSGDTIAGVRNALVELINGDERVRATPSTVFTRIILQSRVAGPEGEGIAYSASVSSGASVLLTALGSTLCCASREGAPVTEEDPARPGEVITIYAAGLGFLRETGDQVTGSIYRGPADNTTNSPVDDAQVGGRTANVLFARLVPGRVGMYEVQLQLNTDIPTNPQTQMWIAQLGYISNIVSIPVVNPNPTN